MCSHWSLQPLILHKSYRIWAVEAQDGKVGRERKKEGNTHDALNLNLSSMIRCTS